MKNLIETKPLINTHEFNIIVIMLSSDPLLYDVPIIGGDGVGGIP